MAEEKKRKEKKRKENSEYKRVVITTLKKKSKYNRVVITTLKNEKVCPEGGKYHAEEGEKSLRRK